MHGLMMHTEDGRQTGLREVCAVPIPVKTDSYRPVAHADLIELVRSSTRTILDLEIKSESYGLSRKDQQMFGVITLDTGNHQNGLSIGLRNSYDKSLSVGISTGAKVFVCDNLCFSGDAMVVLRKHTVNVWRDVTESVEIALRGSQQHYDAMNQLFDQMKTIPVSLDTGYEIIGRALGHAVLKPQQATVAFHDWKVPRHEAFAERNAYSLYNCFTEGLKKGPAGGVMDRHAGAHSFLSRCFSDGDVPGLYVDGLEQRQDVYKDLEYHRGIIKE